LSAFRRHLQFVLLLAGLLALATAAYGFGAAFRAPAPRADGPADVPSGYTVTNIAYTLSAGDPGRIVGVTFALLPESGVAPGATVQAKLVRSSSAYVPCANLPAGSATWECAFSDVPVAEADQLAIRVGGAPDTGHRLWLPLVTQPGQRGQGVFLPFVSR
jgi:hypothetical protein